MYFILRQMHSTIAWSFDFNSCILYHHEWYKFLFLNYFIILQMATCWVWWLLVTVLFQGRIYYLWQNYGIGTSAVIFLNIILLWLRCWQVRKQVLSLALLGISLNVESERSRKSGFRLTLEDKKWIYQRVTACLSIFMIYFIFIVSIKVAIFSFWDNSRGWWVFGVGGHRNQ